ncbi:MAG: histidine phosphatase family protein [Cruoricaptor ignavus]|nr:histidine phosphatase family protein [Cruoricaptor ignavus]
MKTLFLVRHAKSDWNIDASDFDRPLNERGHRDAPKMAKYLLDNGFLIEHFVSSPAKRALTTCRYFAETFGNPNIKKTEDLYEPLLEDFTNTITKLDNVFSSAALFSHNPTISEFASSLTENVLGFPTCAVAVFQVDCDDWSDFELSEKKLSHFFIPKEVL